MTGRNRTPDGQRAADGDLDRIEIRIEVVDCLIEDRGP
ncbi:hypothetical protein FRAHR75_2660002 [Frankia sp. Hr75.2]|nr:hypothetical protein FRAHR75_2660002 [Frankia sp. Hr75.2]SQD97244.1 hypothetical protein FMEAI12_4010002 [Parafrankia sp. Ea1.12]